mmetsp:Transcript_23135/g.58630  ORF Transcript_23135/g.58630 Transcript_23135/m.58630 type:complete len:465 (-) Transcript_23135:130-1524(-)
MVKWCLQKQPGRRPTAGEILSHRVARKVLSTAGLSVPSGNEDDRPRTSSAKKGRKERLPSRPSTSSSSAVPPPALDSPHSGGSGTRSKGIVERHGEDRRKWRERQREEKERALREEQEAKAEEIAVQKMERLLDGSSPVGPSPRGRLEEEKQGKKAVEKGYQPPRRQIKAPATPLLRQVGKRTSSSTIQQPPQLFPVLGKVSVSPKTKKVDVTTIAKKSRVRKEDVDIVASLPDYPLDKKTNSEMESHSPFMSGDGGLDCEKEVEETISSATDEGEVEVTEIESIGFVANEIEEEAAEKVGWRVIEENAEKKEVQDEIETEGEQDEGSTEESDKEEESPEQVAHRRARRINALLDSIQNGKREAADLRQRCLSHVNKDTFLELVQYFERKTERVEREQSVGDCDPQGLEWEVFQHADASEEEEVTKFVLGRLDMAHLDVALDIRTLVGIEKQLKEKQEKLDQLL